MMPSVSLLKKLKQFYSNEQDYYYKNDAKCLSTKEAKTVLLQWTRWPLELNKKKKKKKNKIFTLHEHLNFLVNFSKTSQEYC